MHNLELSYSPLTCERGKITEAEFTYYCENQGLGELVSKMVINPIEEKLKERDEANIKVGTVTLSRTEKKGNSTSWKPTLEALLRFIEIRADDAKAKKIEGCTYVDGVGYCIGTREWGEQINKQIMANTSQSKTVTIGWPSFKKTDPAVRRMEIPYRGLKKIDEETVRLAITANQFKASFKREVIDPFKEANKEWHSNETGYDNKDRIPAQDESPVQRARKIGEGKYVYVQLVRVEDVNYKEIVTSLEDEQERIVAREAVKGYRTTIMENRPFISIKAIRERISKLWEEESVVKARYEITP